MRRLIKPLSIFAIIILTGLAVSLGFTGCSNTSDSIGQINDLFDFEPSPDDTNELKSLIIEVIEEPQVRCRVAKEQCSIQHSDRYRRQPIGERAGLRRRGKPEPRDCCR